VYPRANVVIILASLNWNFSSGKGTPFLFVLENTKNPIVMSNKLKNTIRTFTVQEVSFVNSYPRRIYSELRLRGKWLTDAGFIPRGKVKIEISQKSLVIQSID